MRLAVTRAVKAQEVTTMHLPFLIPLTTAIVVGYIFKNSAEEIAYLTGSITLVNLI